MRRFLCLAAALTLTACSSTEDVMLPSIAGLTVAESDADVATSFNRLTDALEAAGPVGVVAEVDHQANAASAGLDLRPTRVVLFGNPQLGTPLMQANPQAGLDLPQEILVYLDGDGQTIVATNTTDYLVARHGVGAASTLGSISAALDRFVQTAAGADVEIQTGSAASVGRDEGVVAVSSPSSVEVTYGRLRAAIAGNPNLSIVAELDHQANAASVGLELPPIRLIVFGNPALGTPLMQAGQTVGIDLPQKMLVYQNASGGVSVAYNDPAFLAQRHTLGTPAQVGTIREALAGLAATAVGSGG